MRRRHGWRRWVVGILRGLGYTIVGVIGLVVLALCVVLFTRWGTRTALEFGLARYDAMIPGHARAARIDGTLAGTLSIEELELTDANDDPLVRVASLQVDLRLLQIVRLTLGWGELAATGVEVHLWQARGNFGDLAPPGPEKPKEPGTVGPDLPLGFSGALAIDGLDVQQHRVDGSEGPLVRAAILHGNLFAKGRIAEVRIDAASAMVDDAELAVAGLTGSIDWDDPVVRVDGLTVITNRGIVRSAAIELDALALAGEVELSALADINSLVPRSKLPSDFGGLVGLEVHGAGGKAHAWAAVAIDAQPTARLEVLLGGSIDPRLDLAGAGILDIAAVPGKPSTPLFTVMHVVREHDAPLFASLVARGGAERAPVGALVRAEVAPDGSPIDVDAFVYAGDTTIDASATIRDKALASATARVEVPSLGGLRAALHPWVDVPAMSGAVGADLGCNGAAARLDCTLEARVNAFAISQARVGSAKIGASVGLVDGRPRGDVSLHALDLQWADRKVTQLDVAASGDRDAVHVEVAARAPEGKASVSADVAPGEHTVVDLRHLVVKSHPLWVKLDGTSRITVGKGQAEIDGLDVVVNGGRVHVDGSLGEHNDARIAVTRFDLSALDVLELPIELDGVFEARGRFRGAFVDPQVELAAAFHRLEVADQEIGRIDIDLGLHERHAIGSVRWHNDRSERATIDANVDLRRFDHPRGPGLAAGRPVELVAEIEGVQLARLREIVGDDAMTGTAGLTLRVSGTPEKPEVALAVSAVDARIHDLVIERVEATASHVDGRVEATVDAGASWLEQLRVEANAPARLRLAPPYFVLDRRGDVDLAMAVGELQLRALQKLKPDLHVTGSVGVDLVATVHDGRTRAELTLVADDIALDDKPVGDATLAANAGDERVQATLQLRGAAARLVEARVDLPVALAPLRGQFRWRKEENQLVELDIHAADVGALTHLAGIAGFSGTLDGAARLTGPAAAPEMVADLEGHRLVASGRPIGRVELSASHGGGRVEARVRQSQGVAQRIALDASVPLAVDLGTGKVAWNETGEHDLDVHAIGVDEHIVRQFVALPDEMTVDVTAHVAAHGHPEAFEAKGELRANVGQARRINVPIHLTLAADPREQSAHAVIGPFGESTIEISAAAKMPVAQVVRGKGEIRDVPLVAKLESAAFPLSALTPLMPAAMQGPAGRLDLLAGVTGTIGQPIVKGKLEIRDGRITVVPMRQRFDKIHLAVQMKDHDIVLQTLTARSGPGHASAKGNIHLARGDTRGKLELRAHELPIVRPGLPVMKLSSRVVVDLDATGKATEIDIVARKSTLDVFTSSVPAPKRIPTSDAVVYTDVRSKKAKAAKSASGKEPMVPSDMKVSFELGDPIFIRGPQANMTWRGKIELEHRALGQVTAKGALTADGGRINLLNNDFEIERGRVTMPERGELDPYIDVVATTQLPEATVNVIVRGRASRPELRFTSDPPMPESDVFALLVTGATSKGEEGGAAQTKAASLLAAFQNPVLQRELQDSLGIDRVGVGFGENVDQPIVTVGKRVSRRVYVETRYHHNAPRDENNAELQLEYAVKPPAWSIETFFGDAAKGGLGVWWRRRFGGKRAPAPSTPLGAASSTPP